MADQRIKSFLSKIEKLKEKRRVMTAKRDVDPKGEKCRRTSQKALTRKSPQSSSQSSSHSSSSRRRLYTAKSRVDDSPGQGKSSPYKRRHHKRGEDEKEYKEKHIETGGKGHAGGVDKFALGEKQKKTYIKFINDVCDLGVVGLMKEYMDFIKTYKPPDFRHEAFDKNFGKNRYRDVKCLDRTRVILKQEQDYIHANYVTSKYLLNPFICTQAPMKSTVNDFWTMVLQENVRYIVMLCNIIEHGSKKCHMYYPVEEGEKLEFDDITITNLNVDSRDPSTLTSLLQVEKKGTKLLILHMLWTKWPDRGVPENELTPFEILKLARQSKTRPTLVHCSAGVGRTGTIVAIEMGLQQLLNCEPLNLIELCKELRNMRAFSIQTDIQYVYIVKCLLAYAWCCGIFVSTPTLIRKSDMFDQEYKDVMDIENTKPAQGSPSGVAIEACDSARSSSVKSVTGRAQSDRSAVRKNSQHNDLVEDE